MSGKSSRSMGGRRLDELPPQPLELCVAIVPPGVPVGVAPRLGRGGLQVSVGGPRGREERSVLVP